MPLFRFISRAFALAALLAVLWAPSPASAEPMRVNTKTKLREQPGEAAKVLGTLQPDQKVEVLETKGRWLRVRAGKKVGWITRTTVEPIAGAAGGSDTAGAGAGTGAGSDGDWSAKDKPTSDAGAKAADKRVVTASEPGPVRREPRRNAHEVYTLTPDDLATVEGESEQGAWLLIQNENGQMGWIRSSLVQTVDDPAAIRMARARTDESGGPVRTVRKERLIAPRVEAGLGYRGFGMDFESNGGAALDQYRIEASSALTRVGVWVPLEFSGVVIEAGGSYAISLARPGIRYADQEDISFLTHDAEVGANLGYRLLDGLLTVAGSGGFHYSVFRVDKLDNVAYLPSERLTGVTAGGLVELALGGGKYTVRGAFRTLIGGKRAQTAGLEDGTASTAGAWWANLDLDYALFSAFDLAAGYTFEHASTQWAGPSARRPGVTAARRKDNNHLLYVGVGRAF